MRSLGTAAPFLLLPVLAFAVELGATACEDPSHAAQPARAPEENPGRAHEEAQWNRLYDESLKRGARPETTPRDVNPVALGAGAVGLGGVGAAIAVGASRDAGMIGPPAKDTATPAE